MAKNEIKAALHPLPEARHCVVFCGGYKVANKREEEREKSIVKLQSKESKWKASFA